MSEATGEDVPLLPLKLYFFNVLKVDPVGGLMEPPSEIATRVDSTRLAELLIKYHEATGKPIYAVRLGHEHYPTSIIFTDSKPSVEGGMVKIRFFDILGFAVPSELKGIFINHMRFLNAVQGELDINEIHGVLDEEAIRRLGFTQSPTILIPMSRVLSISDHPPRTPYMVGQLLKLISVVAIYAYIRGAGG